MILAIFDLQVSPLLPNKFQVNWPFDSGEAKKDFQDDRLRFQIGILAILDLPVIPLLPSKFRVKWPFGSGEEAKQNYFQDGGHLGFPIGMSLASFDLQVTPMLPTKFKRSGEKRKTQPSQVALCTDVEEYGMFKQMHKPAQ